MTFSSRFQLSEKNVYTALCIGIIYSLVFWTLLNSLFCLALCAYWLFFSKKQFDLSSRRGKLMLLFVSLYLLGLAGMLYTANTSEGTFRLQQRAGLLIFPLIFGTTQVLTPAMIKKLLTHFMLATVAGSIASLGYRFIQFLGNGQFELLTKDNLTVFPDQYPFILGCFCLMSIIILADLLRGASRKLQIWLVLAGVLISGYIMLLSLRVIVACWLMILLFYTFRYIRNTTYRLVAGGALLLVVAVSIATIPPLNRQWKELVNFSGSQTIPLDREWIPTQDWGGKSIRFTIWTCSMDIIRDHWLIGVGTGDIQDTLQATYDKRKFYFASRYNRYNAHNQYIQFFLGHGLLGPLLLLACIVIPVIGYRYFAMQPIYLLFLLIFSIICFSEVMLDTNKGVIWYSFFNSIFAFCGIESRAPVTINKKN